MRNYHICILDPRAFSPDDDVDRGELADTWFEGLYLDALKLGLEMAEQYAQEHQFPREHLSVDIAYDE